MTFSIYKNLIRPILFLFDAEKVHHFVFRVLKKIQKSPILLSLIEKKFKNPTFAIILKSSFSTKKPKYPAKLPSKISTTTTGIFVTRDKKGESITSKDKVIITTVLLIITASSLSKV